VSETVLGVMAGSWGVIMALSPLMQIRRMVHLRSSRDVSIGYLLVVVIGFSVWVAYGIAIRNLALIVSNTLAFVVGVTTVGVALHFRRARGDATDRPARDATDG
jgi:MtN3 and saliva related transmembrane protein